MTNRQDLRDELRETFVVELEERLASMNDALMALERPAPTDRRRALVEALLRDAHTLKGGAQLLGWDQVAALTHSLEAHLAGLRDDASAKGLDLTAVFPAVDALARARHGDELSAAEIEAISRRLEPTTPERGEQALLGLDQAQPVSAQADPVVSEQPADTWKRRGAVQVPTERLDRLLARVADLLTARDTSQLQRRRMAALAQELGAWGDEASALQAAARERVFVAAGSAAISGSLLERTERTAGEAERLAREARSLAGDAQIADQRLGQLVDQLEAELHDLRMVPAHKLFRQFPRMVRDLAIELGKQAHVEGIGWDTPIDRDLLERLREPLLHLLRNAVDHGIETVEVRERSGKPPAGRIAVEASISGRGIVIQVRDDGAGIDRERILERASAEKLVTPGEAGTDPLRLVFAPGLSTSPIASPVSGRGVGLDVVATVVASLRGTVDARSEPGVGTAITLQLPLSLVSTRVLVIAVSDERYAFSSESVERVVRVRPEELLTIGGRACIKLDAQGPVVVGDLASAVGAAADREGDTDRFAVLLDRPDGRAAVLVDEVVGEREVVVKDIMFVRGATPLVQGAAIVERDVVLPVLDSSAVVEHVNGAAGGAFPRPSVRSRREAERPLRILVVDDSLTTRTLEKNILAAAGFDVGLAADGREALRLLHHESFDLLVCDVDMPGLDGIQVTEHVRKQDALRDLPVILVTGKESPEDRERGLRAGADVYVMKSKFDHDALLTSIRELVG